VEQFFAQWGPAASIFWVRALWALALFLLTVWLAGVGRRTTQQSLKRTKAHPNAILFLGRIVQVSIAALGIVVALGILGESLPELTAFVALGTVAITLALQDVLRNFVSGLYLLIERPFEVGDTIEVSGQQGVIEDVEIRTTIMRTASGDRVIVPNGVLFSSIVTQKKISKEQN
jgi:small conductance mechanosensitive channel